MKSKEEEELKQSEEKKQELLKAQENNSLIDKNWDAEHIALLTKAIVKYPPGTIDRWLVIANFCDKD